MERVRTLLHTRAFGIGAGIVWLAAMAFAHRAVFLFQPHRRSSDPVEAFFFEANGATPQLVYGVFAWLLWTHRRRIWRAIRDTRGTFWGGPLIAAGAMIYVWATYVGQIDLLLDSCWPFCGSRDLFHPSWFIISTTSCKTGPPRSRCTPLDCWG
jgi:hypothetical protein